MTPRATVFYHISVAYTFAIACVERGYKEYNRSASLLLKSLDTIKKGLTEKQVAKAFSKVEKYARTKKNVSVYDFLDHIKWAMEIARRGRDKKINSWLALAATNVPEDIDEENA